MTYDLIIIGAGISGLSLASLSSHYGLKTLVLEASPRIGGCIATHTFSTTPNFWVETGAHTCFNSYGHLITILKELNLLSHIQPKQRVNFKLLHHGQLHSLLYALHPLELIRCLPRIAYTSKTGLSVKEYYSQILGSKNYRDLLGPAFNAVICQPADNFPAEFLFRPKPKHKNIPRSFTFKTGLQIIPDAIAKQNKLELLTNTAIATIAKGENGELKAFTTNGESFVTKHLALAISPDQAANILAIAFPELAGLLINIRVAEITSISIAVPHQQVLQLKPLAGVIAPYEPFYAAVTRDYLKDKTYRGFTFHFPKDQLDIMRQVGRIGEVLKLHKEYLNDIIQTQHKLPALRINHLEWVTKIDKVLARTNLILTGNYFLGVSIEDCITRSTNEWQRYIANIQRDST